MMVNFRFRLLNQGNSSEWWLTRRFLNPRFHDLGNTQTRFPSPFFSLRNSGRDNSLLEMYVKLDDLLEQQQNGIQLLDWEYIQLSVNKTILLLNRTFLKK